MSPEQTLSQSLHDYPPPPRSEAPIQLIQGWYYVFVGLWVALGIGSIQSSVDPYLDLSSMWFVRVLAAGIAVVGVGLIYASRKQESIPLAMGGAPGIAAFITVGEIVALANGVLPVTFLLDTGMEIGFLVWWSIAIYQGERLVHLSSEPGKGAT